MISRCSDARIGEEKTLRASACELRAARTAAATSSRPRTSRTSSFKFNDRAALAVIVQLVFAPTVQINLHEVKQDAIHRAAEAGDICAECLRSIPADAP